MDDMISRQAALNCFHDWIDKRGDVHSADEMPEYRAIEALPSAQPEIVRCKDCKFYDPTHPYGTVAPDAFHCKINDRFYETSHFCGYGERRE